MFPQQLQKKRYQNPSFDFLKNKPFWIWDKEEHRKQYYLLNTKCCFNHIVGLPVNEKTGLANPMFDYEEMIFKAIFQTSEDQKDPKDRHVWVKKATGLGITEFILRVMLWLCTRDTTFKNSQMCIVTGPELAIAVGLIQRMKRIFENINIFIQNKETVLEVNGVMIKAFPSNHLETYRGLTSPKFIFLDEGDFFRESNIRNVRDTTERYIAKSNPYIVMVSTPNKPDLLFQQIEQEPEDKCMYHRLFFNYQWGLDKMFTQDEIDLQRVSPSFDREYDLKYSGKIGNVFSIHDIDRAIELGERYKEIPMKQGCSHFGGIDPGFSKTTPIYIGELDTENQCVRIIYCKRYDNAIPSELVKAVWTLHKQYLNLHWFVDASNRGFINELKFAFGENQNWNKPEEVSHRSNRIIPVNFGSHNDEHLLEHLHSLLSAGYIAIPKEYDQLITSLKTAQATEWDLNKDETVFDDDLDCVRLLLKEVKIK